MTKTVKSDSVLTKMRGICLSLPDTKETLTWGEPHFRVGDKIFAGCGDEKGKLVIGFKLELDHADAMVQDPRFWRAAYVGHKGWVSMDGSRVKDWDEVRALILESYRLIAPKKTLAKLSGAPGPYSRQRRRRPTGPSTPSRSRVPRSGSRREARN